MVTFLTTLLCISIAGLATLILAKRWEMRSGRLLFSGSRPALGAFVGGALHFVERQAPAILRRLLVRLIASLRTRVHFGVAWVVLHAERLLETTLHTLRHNTTEPRGDGEASAFLREVAEHKKSLLEGSGEQKNAIYEE